MMNNKWLVATQAQVLDDGRAAKRSPNRTGEHYSQLESETPFCLLTALWRRCGQLLCVLARASPLSSCGLRR